jgi:hypothetical protein
MSWRRIVVLFGLLAVMGIAIFLVNRGERQKQENEGKLLSVTAANVTKLELQRGDQTFRFVRSDPVWNLELPLKAKADRVSVENILDDFCALKYDKVVEKEAKDLSRYRLDKPEIELRIYEKDPLKPSYAILIGTKNEMDSSSYARLSTRTEVVTIPDYKRNYLEKKLFEFRDKKFFEFDTTDASAMEFSYQNASFAFRKKEGEWFMEKPLFSRAVESKVTDILSQASQLEAKAFTDKADAGKLKEYGFEKPLLDVGLKLKDKEKRVKVIRKGETYLAFTPDFDEICEVNMDFVDKFAGESKDFREKKVGSFSAFEVKEIDFKSSPFSFLLKKNKESKWELAKGTPAQKLDEEKVNRLLGSLEELEATDFIDPPVSSVSFPYSITIRSESWQRPQELKSVILQLSAVKDDSVIAGNPSLPYRFKVSKEIIDKLPKKLDDLLQSLK